MPAIARDSLMSLEAYAKARPEFRARVLAHKKARTVHLGEHVTLLFEDELTIRYQIQEMLRIERVFEEEGIRDELDAYNPLVPDGSNLKATMLIEYEDVDERKSALAKLNGIERCVFVDVEGRPRIVAIADEDLPRCDRREDRRRALPALRARPRIGVGAQARRAARDRRRSSRIPGDDSRGRRGDARGARRRSRLTLVACSAASGLHENRAPFGSRRTQPVPRSLRGFTRTGRPSARAARNPRRVGVSRGSCRTGPGNR